MSKDLYLGTAGWGLRTPKEEAFQILNDFVSEGFDKIDTATNYPIDGVPSNFGLATRWLQEWLLNNTGKPLRIFVKIGSLSNNREDESDLRELFIKETFERLQIQLGDSLYGIGIHWDNRDFSMKDGILNSINQLKSFASSGIKLGFSGVRHPAAYKATGAVETDWIIQVKEYLGDFSARQKYSKFFPENAYIAYGLSHFVAQFPEYTKMQKKKAYFQGLTHILNCDQLQGLIFGPSNRYQAREVVNHVIHLNSV